MSEKNYCNDSDILRMKNFHRNINTIFNATSTAEYKINNNDIPIRLPLRLVLE